jgi:putative SOS response-associated peptidase YedK
LVDKNRGDGDDMCGRYALRTPVEALWKRFALDGDALEDMIPLMRPRYNIAPSQEILTIVHDDNPNPQYMHWGMLTSPQHNEEMRERDDIIINARAETLFEKPTFREAAKYKRCLILADGFYEWQTRAGQKTPLYFGQKDDQPFAFAGIWHERVSLSGENSYSCAIVTTSANKLMGQFHNRMPVILTREAEDVWLDLEVTIEAQLAPLLVPYDVGDMVAYEVSKMVNSPQNDTPEMIFPVSLASYQMCLLG